MSNPILLAPGPVQLHPEVQKILSQPMIHHRTPEFDSILKRVLENLKFLFQTNSHVYIHSSTGSGGMESLLVNTLSPKDRVLAIVSGKFGERWAEIATIYGAHVDRLNVPWGDSINPGQVEDYLNQHPDTKIVLCQACETSTATTHPIRQLGEIIAKTQALFLVDGITAVGAYPLQMDAFLIDGLVAGSQKGIMLPTGLSFVGLSAKTEKVMEKATTPRYYFDLSKEKKANQNGETFFSSSVSLIKALDFILLLLKTHGLEKHFADVKRRADFTRIMNAKLGLKLFSKSPSDSVTALLLPSTIDGAKFRTYLEDKYSVTVMGGQDQLKGKIIRIGHMGFILDDHLIETQFRLALALKDFNLLKDLDVNSYVNDCRKWLKDNPR